MQRELKPTGKLYSIKNRTLKQAFKLQEKTLKFIKTRQLNLEELQTQAVEAKLLQMLMKVI